MSETAAKPAKILVPVLIGSALSVVLGVYGNLHRGDSVVFKVSGFENLVHVKAVLAAVSGGFALVQVLSALVMWGKIPGVRGGSWVGPLHRWSGRIAFFVAVPVGVFCLYGIGFQHYDTRVLLHSLLGCLFFGAFTIKMLVLTKTGLADWVLPVIGGTVFAVLMGAVLTSALWYFST